MKDFNSDLFDPGTVMDSTDYSRCASSSDADFGFAFNDSNFSDRILRIEIMGEPLEPRPHFDGCTTIVDWARHRKRRHEDIKKDNVVDLTLLPDEQILNRNQLDMDDFVPSENQDEEAYPMVEESMVSPHMSFHIVLSQCGRFLILKLPKMSSKASNSFLVIFMVVLPCLIGLSHSECDFKAIFNFGDSNSDTGGFYAAFPAESGPYGMTYFKKPSGRASDGRLTIDFIAQALGLPFLSPYLQSIGSDYTHGANYATLASTVLLPNTSLFVTGISPFSLAIQLNQMKQFKTKVDEVDQQESKLPSTDIFGKSLYTFYIGQNDFTSNLASIGIGGVQEYLPQVVSQIASTIKEIYNLGGRTFMVLNLAPVGCYPALLVELPHDNSDLDEFGCLISYNKAVVDYNNMLKETLRQMRESLFDASVLYMDVHTVLLELFQHPTSHGLQYGTKACCGYGGGDYNFDPKVYCGNTKEINGSTVTAAACDDPYNYVSWDGIHTTEAANKLITYAILNGSYSDPSFPFQEHCDLQPLG